MALFPETKTIVMAVGASEADQVLKRNMQQAALAWQGNVAMQYLDGHTLEQMRAAVAHLPSHTLLVTGNVNRDVGGNIATPVQFSEQLARLANVPAFGMYNATVGKGILGGSMLHIERAAQQVAQMSLARAGWQGACRAGRLAAAGPPGAHV